jgi:uncharacterized peroxidase-related enzyme
MMPAIARLTLSPKTIESAEPEARTSLESALQNLGFVPNMYATMANSPGLLATYLTGYNYFRKESHLTPQEQEVVFLTISAFHGCTYCVAAHSMIADKMSKVSPATIHALRTGSPSTEPKLQALSAFTRIMVEFRGKPSPSHLQQFVAAGFSERHVLEIILAIAVKTLSNYSNHLFCPPVDAPFSGYRWTP